MSSSNNLPSLYLESESQVRNWIATASWRQHVSSGFCCTSYFCLVCLSSDLFKSVSCILRLCCISHLCPEPFIRSFWSLLHVSSRFVANRICLVYLPSDLLEGYACVFGVLLHIAVLSTFLFIWSSLKNFVAYHIGIFRLIFAYLCGQMDSMHIKPPEDYLYLWHCDTIRCVWPFELLFSIFKSANIPFSWYEASQPWHVYIEEIWKETNRPCFFWRYIE